MSIIVSLICIFASYLNKVYSTKWKYFIWLALAVRLILPITISLPDEIIGLVVSDNSNAKIQIVQVDNTPLPGKIELPNNNNKSDIADNNNTNLYVNDKTSQISRVEVSNQIISILTIIWMLGTVFFLFYYLLRYIIFRRRMLGWSKECKEPLVCLMVEEYLKRMKIPKKVTVLVTYKISSPTMLGFFQPILIIPHERYKKEELEFILYHEFVHYKRKDIWYKLILLIANALHWFNPIIYVMSREANIDLERACDEEVVRGNSYDYRKRYSETILSCVREQCIRDCKMSTYFNGGVSTLKKRFQNILSLSKKKNGLVAFFIVLSCSLFMSGFITVLGQEKSTPLNENNSVQNISSDNKKDSNDNKADWSEQESSNQEDAQESPQDIIGNDLEKEPDVYNKNDAMKQFAMGFINEFTSSVANQENMVFDNYISNKNLLEFANKFHIATRNQVKRGASFECYSDDNRFNLVEIHELENNVYHITLQYDHNIQSWGGYTSSGCELLVTLENDQTIQLVDFCFSNMDGIDELTTGRSYNGHDKDWNAVNPKQWDDETWVNAVMKKMEKYM